MCIRISQIYDKVPQTVSNCPAKFRWDSTCDPLFFVIFTDDNAVPLVVIALMALKFDLGTRPILLPADYCVFGHALA
jgi:hypothetical protein